ncbi:E3 ubiquitin-protein ligase tom1, partial [Coemansia sp. RSA 1358]
MTKIKKLHHKRHNHPPQEIQWLREQLESTSVNNIHNVLEPYNEWPFVRGDMYHWITVLNRFDDILADVSEKYELHTLQKTEFDSDTQKTLVAVMQFSRLLMENCVNRNLYSSIEYLDCLLNTSDPEVLEATLRMLIRSAPRWSYQRDIKANLVALSARLMIIASPWNLKRDAVPFINQGLADDIASHTNEFRLLVQDGVTEVLQKHAGVIHYQFFRTADDIRRLEEEDAASASNAGASTTGNRKPQSKRGQSQSAAGASRGSASSITEGLITIDVPISELDIELSASIHKQMEQAFDQLVAKYRISQTHHYELRHRIYVALALATGNTELRLLLLRSRIYAATVLSQLMGEQEFKNIFLSREPNFTSDIITVLQPEVHAPLSLQTAVLLALEGLLKQRREVSGAYVSLNASANHGVLMFILRKALTNIGEPPVFPYEFMSALYMFLTSMTTTMNGGQLLVSAGAIPVFVSALKQAHPGHLRGTGRVARLLWSLISSVTSAFPAFCGANGISTLVNRMHTEVLNAVAIGDANPEAANDLSSPVKMLLFSEYPKQVYRRREVLPPEQIYLLKELFKLLCNLMQQPSYQDRLRNLVETTLPETLRVVVTHPGVFGNNIYGPAISISAMLVHNEPTSLPILQEARLPQALLESLENHVPYNGDVIINIPSVIGAFCLNDSGMEQFSKSSVISKALNTFADPEFIRVLQEGDVTGLFGAGLDEFMRHFPVVKEPIMDSIIEMIKNIITMGSKDSPLLKYNPGNTLLLRSNKEDSMKAYHDDLYGMMLESMTTFFEGLLEQRAHSELFVEKNGWELVVQTVRSPLLPFAFVKSRAFESLNGLSSMLLDTSQTDIFKVLFKELKHCLEQPALVGDNLEGSSSQDAADAYIALSNPTYLSDEQYAAMQENIHNSVSATGAIALITYLINGSGGGSLTRCVKNINDVISTDDFLAIITRVCATYLNSIQKAVAAEHALSLLPEPRDDKKADSKPSSSSKGKEAENTLPREQRQQDMDVDSVDNIDTTVDLYVRANHQSLAEVAIAYTLEAGDFIECISNSLSFDSKPRSSDSNSASADASGPKIGPVVAKELTSFIKRMLALCLSAEHTIVGAQLIDQSMVTIMKTLVFARNRIYIKLRIFTELVEQGGLDDFCQLLEKTLVWTESIPVEDEEPSSIMSSTADTIRLADPRKRVRRVLENVLESMLSILSFMVDGEPIVDCPEYSAICQEHIAHQKWFHPGGLLTKIRLTALPVLQKIWHSPLLIYSSGNLIQAFIGGIGPIIRGNRETVTPTSGSELRPHFSSLLERHRGSQANRRNSGTHTPIPLLSRALATTERPNQSLLESLRGDLTAAADDSEHWPERIEELTSHGISLEEIREGLLRNNLHLANTFR